MGSAVNGRQRHGVESRRTFVAGLTVPSSCSLFVSGYYVRKSARKTLRLVSRREGETLQANGSGSEELARVRACVSELRQTEHCGLIPGNFIDNRRRGVWTSLCPSLRVTNRIDKSAGIWGLSPSRGGQGGRGQGRIAPRSCAVDRIFASLHSEGGRIFFFSVFSSRRLTVKVRRTCMKYMHRRSEMYSSPPSHPLPALMFLEFP